MGGIPRGHISELVGAPTSGMATLVLKVIANAQVAGDVAAFVDLGRTFDPAYAARCGVNVADLLLVHGPSRGHALDVAHDLVASRAVGVMVFHSIRALLAEGERLPAVTGGLRRVQRALAGSGCALIFLTPNEAGAPPRGANGASSTPLASVAGLRLLVQREAWLDDGHDVRGYRARVRIGRSKFGPEGREVSIEITFDGVVDGDGA
jgi:recombination protein RecA